MKKTKGCAIFLIIGMILLFLFQYPTSESVVSNDDSLPRTSSGLVDYLALSNQKFGEGVTVDNNIVVDFFQLKGAGAVQVDIRDEFYDLLGNPEATDEGTYQSLEEFMQAEISNDDYADFLDEYHNLMVKPWTEKDQPLVKRWLIKMKECQEQVIAGSKKPYYFHPVITPNESTGAAGALMPYLTDSREYARGLSIRAMNELADGEIEAAMETIAAIRRMGNLMQQAPTLVGQLVSYAIVGIGFSAERQLVKAISENPDFPPELIETYRQLVRNTSPRSNLARSIRNGERGFSKDAIQRLEKGDLGVLRMYSGSTGAGEFPMKIVAGITAWKLAETKVIAFNERLAASFEIEDAGERRAAMQKLESELAANEKELAPAKIAWRALKGPKSRGELAGDMIVNMLTPSFIHLDDAGARIEMYVLTDIALALELYRRANGKYPDELEKLVPEFAAAIPLDEFSMQPLNYVKTDDGYRLWSWGRDRLDQQRDGDGNLIDWSVEDEDSTDDIMIGIGDK